jgi:hypothetical protein
MSFDFLREELQCRLRTGAGGQTQSKQLGGACSKNTSNFVWRPAPKLQIYLSPITQAIDRNVVLIDVQGIGNAGNLGFSLSVQTTGGCARKGGGNFRTQEKRKMTFENILADDFRTATGARDVAVTFNADETIKVVADNKSYIMQCTSDDDEFLFVSDDGDVVAFPYSHAWLNCSSGAQIIVSSVVSISLLVSMSVIFVAVV